MTTINMTKPFKAGSINEGDKCPACGNTIRFAMFGPDNRPHQHDFPGACGQCFCPECLRPDDSPARSQY